MIHPSLGLAAFNAEAIIVAATRITLKKEIYEPLFFISITNIIRKVMCRDAHLLETVRRFFVLHKERQM